MGPVPRALAPLALAALVGCVQPPAKKQAPEPFVFRSLNLRQQNAKGEPAWELTSPEARYDIERRLAQARNLQGVTYLRGKPHYRVSARVGTVLNDGELIQLEGDVRITLLGQDPVVIRSQQVRWLPRQELMVMDSRAVATDRRSRLTAEKARFLLQQDRLELRGQPQLERWDPTRTKGARSAGAAASAPAEPAVRPVAQEILKVRRADWSPGSGLLQAAGPVRGRRSEGQLITASALEGNLRQGFVDLLAPVRVSDPGRKGWLEAQRSRWDLTGQTLRTATPFRGQLDKLAIQGNALDIDLQRELVVVPAACALQQPGETLRAQSCRWNWSTGRFEAVGDVVLSRSAYRQVTRAARLEGAIGKQGQAVFTTPGGRVNSELTLPPPGAGGTKARRPAAPVEF
jgi:LPS export ABC transporter protein LptC